jgi:hypothetical protein
VFKKRVIAFMRIVPTYMSKIVLVQKSMPAEMGASLAFDCMLG